MNLLKSIFIILHSKTYHCYILELIVIDTLQWKPFSLNHQILKNYVGYL